MSLTQTPATSPHAASLPGAVVIGRIRRVLITSLIAAVLYPAFMRSSAGSCAGGVDGDGGFVDAAGRAINEAPRCVQLTLSPSPLVYVGIALIVLVGIGRVTKAPNESAALRTLDRSAVAVGLLVAVAIVVSQVWLRLVPVEDFLAGSASVFNPFPFGFIDIEDALLPTP